MPIKELYPELWAKIEKLAEGKAKKDFLFSELLNISERKTGETVKDWLSRISDSGGNKLRTIFKRHSQGVEYLEPKGKASDFTPHNFRHTMLTEAEALKRLGRGDFVDVVNQISLSHLGDASMKSVYGVDGTLLTKRIVKDIQTFNKLRKELIILN